MVDVRPVRLDAGPPLFLLPVALIVLLFGGTVLMAQVAPGREDGGVYQVTTPQFVIPAESLTCARTGDDATCTTPVGERTLTIDIRYTGPYAAQPSGCTARHGDRTVPCASRMGDYGHASHSVWITDDFGLSPAQAAELRAAVPWWRVRDHRDTVGLALTGTLAVAAGVVTFLFHRRARPVAPDRRLLLVTGTTLLSMGLFSATVPVFGLPPVQMMYMVTPMALLAAVPMAAWQWQLSGSRGGRVVSAIVATVAVFCYTSVAMFVFLLQSGFED